MTCMRLSRLAGSLHLYAGLFLSPFVVLFAVSVFVLITLPSQPSVPSSAVRRKRSTFPQGSNRSKDGPESSDSGRCWTASASKAKLDSSDSSPRLGS